MTPFLRRAALLALSVAPVATTLAACGNAVDADVIGTAAVTVASDGRPVAVVRVCGGEVDTIRLMGDRTGLAEDEPNPVVGTWRVPAGRDGTFDLVLGAAGTGWQGPQELALDERRRYVLIAVDSGEDAETTQVSFTPDQLASLAPDQVVVGDGEVVARTELDACAG
ncbi:hypothetical protein [Pimelobacter simplex]|uniref:hypothetical protein n=1 Tax=Nocardioides simplex TaxID=2045 RepID=UPI0019339AD0|nr:hypothetical protein [Pimelobacter simplex]